MPDLPEFRTTWTQTKGVWLRKTETSLVPWGDEAVEQLWSVKVGKLIVGDLHGVRNPKALRLYWGLCTVVAQALDTTKEKIDGTMRAALLPGSQWTDVLGNEHIDYPSIAVTAMPEAEFRAFLRLAIDTMATMMAWAPTDLRAHFNDIVDGDVRRLRDEGYFR